MKAVVILFSLVMILAAVVQTKAQENSAKNTKLVMHRYLVERTFPNGLNIPLDQVGKDICLNVVSNNAEDNVTWVHSYVTMDKKKTFCIYDAPSPDAIRKSAKANSLPVDQIIEVSVLDPYFYK
ncbi:MAG TPA: DUF4242 domain-containing protein [Ignavibacteriaceae bacterium]|jgi:hypothetical protein|nr:DUF4242 domain-containing protein [Ignavibacteriaceae bacterium]